MIITETQFKNDTQEGSISLMFESILEKYLNKGSYVFISHKHDEIGYVYRLREMLKRYGYGGYVDWEDDSMSAGTNGETALKLKERIKSSDKFILIATEAAIESKWCNWETGFADAHKYVDHIALLPIKKEHENYKGGEYLQIYPSIQIGRNKEYQNVLDYYIKYPDGKTMTLWDWLKI